MKKILLATALVIALGFGANAQHDGFYNNWDDNGNGLERGDGIELPSLPTHNLDSNQNAAPVGSGLLILTALGAGYAMTRKEK